MCVGKNWSSLGLDTIKSTTTNQKWNLNNIFWFNTQYLVHSIAVTELHSVKPGKMYPKGEGVLMHEHVFE